MCNSVQSFLQGILTFSFFFYAIDFSSMQNVKFYTYKQLKVATEDFSLANKIGEGGFGSVYKVAEYLF